MPRRERKIDRGRGMIELGPQPAVKRVALHAIRCRELRPRLAVHRIRGLHVIRQVAGRTFRRQPQKLAYRGALVAVFALQGRVGAQQREAVHVLLHLLHGNIPALHCVAIRAIRPHLPIVHVGVAVLAILSNIGENWFHVALRALHLLMHATKGIPGFVVIELGSGSNRFPTRSRVTVLARDRQRPVRTSSGLPLRLRQRAIGWWPRKDQKPAQNLDYRMRNCPLDFQSVRPISVDGIVVGKSAKK